MPQLHIRRATPQDVPAIFSLIEELAMYEKAADQVSNTPAQLLKDGFGENPIYGCFMGEIDGKIEGMALYYYRYSTWKGKRIYLEDLIVREEKRGFGLGKILFEAIIEEGKQTTCSGMMWQVLDWNEPAIKFYERYGTRFDGEWLNCHLDF